MKIKSIICVSVLGAVMVAFSSCATNRNLSALEERKSVASKTESVLSNVKGLLSYDAVYTREKQLRIFVKTADGELSDALVSEIKKLAAETNGIPEENVAVFKVSEANVDAK